jgi:hypothetical protein
MAGYALIEAVKAKKGIPSDNQIAIALGVDRNNVSAWKNRKSKPDAETLLDLMILGDIDAKEAKRLLHGGYIDISLLSSIGFLAVSTMALTHHAGIIAIARDLILYTVYYVKKKVVFISASALRLLTHLFTFKEIKHSLNINKSSY